MKQKIINKFPFDLLSNKDFYENACPGLVVTCDN